MTDDIYLLLGTNLGNKAANLDQATSQIQRSIGKISKLSRIYETAAWGKTEQPSFYNQVVTLVSHFSPVELLAELHKIEIEMGRVRYEKWGERVIDIDILFYGDSVINTPQLTIPHPEIQNRKFTLAPLAEVRADFYHPVLKQTIRALLESCSDPLQVIPLAWDELPGN